ncbi:MAG: DUF302 domain-containing protein [Anaerolineales bacterium]|nr:DUF302 domain-containing protein [Anaerolineales bacterium]
MNNDLGFEIHLDLPYDETLERVAAALKSEGFGVLTRIDVKATLKEKLDQDFRPYTILGACNPPLAHRALSTDARVGLMLPCNVTVEAITSGGTLVRIADPAMMLQVGALSENSTLRQIADEARQRLERVAHQLEQL